MLSSFSTVIGSRLLALAGCLSRSEYFCIYWVRAKLSLEAVLRLTTKKRGGGILQARHFEGEKVTVASQVVQG